MKSFSVRPESTAPQPAEPTASATAVRESVEDAIAQHIDPAATESTAIMHAPAFSRRAFFCGAGVVGALSFLGSVHLGRNTVVNAYADESGSSSFSIYVLARDEVPVMAMKVQGDNLVPVEGAQVTITSLFNNKTLTVETNKDGFAPANIRPLSFECEDDLANSYSFYGRVFTCCDGYRNVYFPQEYIQSAVSAAEDGTRSNTIEIPMEPMTQTASGTPEAYLSCVALDGVDILHSTAPANVGDYNTADHTLYIEVCTCDDTPEVSASVIQDTSQIERGAAEYGAAPPRTAPDANPPTADNYASITFSGKYLSQFKVGQVMRVWFHAQGQEAKVVTLPLTFERALYMKEGGEDSFSLTVGCDPDGNKEMRSSLSPLPWLFDKNDSFFASIPGCPIEFFSDAAGNFGISATLFSYTFYRNVDGENVTPKDKFQAFGGKAGKAAWNNWKQNTLKKSWNNTKTAAKNALGNDAVCGCGPISSSFTAKLELSAMLYGKTFLTSLDADETNTESTADAAINFYLGVDASVGTQLFICAIPFYVNGDFSASLKAQLTIGMAFKRFFEKITWDNSRWGKAAVEFSMVLCLQAGLSVGVGFMGIASAGLRGYVNGKVNLVFNVSRTDRPFPHAIASGEAGLDVILQFLIFKKTYQAIEPATLGPADNWDGKSLTSALSGGRLLADVDVSDAEMFTQDELKALSEYKGVEEETSGAAGDGAGDGGEGGAGDTSANTTTTAAPFTLANTEGLNTNFPMKYTRTSPLRERELSTDAPTFKNPYSALESGAASLSASGILLNAKASARNTANLTASSSAYNPHLGLSPSIQEAIYEDVFSNTRLKTYVGRTAFNESPEDDTVMARLLPGYVCVPGSTDFGQVCTRLCIKSWNASEHKFGYEHVVDFSAEGVAAFERMDVDFDIDYIRQDGVLYMAFAITSVCVPIGTTYDPDTAENLQFVSFVLYNATAGEFVWSYSLHSRLVEGFATYHPRVAFQGNYTEASTPRLCFYYFQKDTNRVPTDSNNGIFATSMSLNGEMLVKNAPVSAGASGEAATSVAGSDIIKGTFEVTTCTTAASGAEKTYTVLGWSGINSVNASSGSGGSSGSGEASSDSTTNKMCATFQAFYFSAGSVHMCSTLEAQNVAAISKRGNDATNYMFTYTPQTDVPCEKKYQAICFDGATEALTQETSATYLTDAGYISSSNGRRLYCVRVSEGIDPALPDEVKACVSGGGVMFSNNYYNEDTQDNFGGISLGVTEREPVYQLYESRWIDSMQGYHEFYPIARLDFVPDSTSVLTCSGAQRDFAMAYITDIDNSKGNVYHVSVPDVLAIQCDGAAPGVPFAFEGDMVPFEIDVTNTGNALLTGFTVTVTDSNGKEISSTEYADLRDYLRVSKDNYHVVTDDSGYPTYNEDGSMKSEFVEDARDVSGILWPGFTRTYCFAFEFPAGYEGDTEFKVSVSNPRSNPYANTLSAASVLQQVQLQKASLAALAGSGAAGAGTNASGNDAPTLMAQADHLSWLAADEFSEALLGADCLTVEDPRTRPLNLGDNTTQGAFEGFSAVPAIYSTATQDAEESAQNAADAPTALTAQSAANNSASAKAAADMGDKTPSATLIAAGAAAAAAGIAVTQAACNAYDQENEE